MRQPDETSQAIRKTYEEDREKAFDPRPPVGQNRIGRPDVRLRVVAAPGGFAFVEDKAAIERS